MTNPVSFELASERLRLALPLMSKYQIPIAPLNYAVWYEYVAGTRPVINHPAASRGVFVYRLHSPTPQAAGNWTHRD